MKQFYFISLILTISAMCMAQEPAPVSVNEITQDIATKIGKVSSFSAQVTTSESGAGEAPPVSTSELTVSRLYGWKLVNSQGPGAMTLLTDFNTFYQYFPSEHRVMKTTADSPELKAMLTKPVSDMNPLILLEPESIKYLGKEELNGETVYHVEGTTESQLMPGGPTIDRLLSVWISTADGLPRKTVEGVGISTGTTVYSNVKINLPLTPKDFTFTPPPNVTMIDTNEQIRRVKEQMRKPPVETKPTPASQ